MLRIATPSALDPITRDRLAARVTLRHIDRLEAADPCRDDLILLDARESLETIAVERTTAGSLDDRFHRLPLILLVRDGQRLDLSALAWAVDDCLAEHEFASDTGLWRLERLVARFDRALALDRLHGPEFGLLQAIVDHTVDWLIVKDLDHRFLMVSDEFARTVGLPKEAIIGRNDLEIGTNARAVLGDPEADWPGFWPQDDAVIASGKPAFEENEHWRPFAVDSRYKRTERVPLKNMRGQVIALLVRTTDVTDTVRAERSLKARSAMLRRVTQEKRKAEANRRIAEEAIAAKDRFMAAASHDLRQPLHAMGLFLAVLDRRLRSRADQEVLEKIKHSSDALNELFNSLLDMSRLDAGVVDVERRDIPVGPLLQTLHEEFAEQGARKALDVEVSPSADFVHSDPVLLSRILRNLLQNAVTHTERGRVVVTCQRDGTHLSVRVADSGPGIPEAEQDAIFSEFYQLDSAQARSTRGLGLGLAIVSRLATLLDIRISLESTLGVGTTFQADVPIGTARRRSLPPVAAVERRIVGYRALVIDDEPDIRDGLTRILDDHGCEALTAASASEALALLHRQSRKPDIVIVDYRLENNLYGDAAIRSVRALVGSHLPAIIVTGDTSAERLRDAANTGCPLLHKPVRPADLVRTMAELLNSVPA